MNYDVIADHIFEGIGRWLFFFMFSLIFLHALWKSKTQEDRKKYKRRFIYTNCFGMIFVCLLAITSLRNDQLKSMSITDAELDEIWAESAYEKKAMKSPIKESISMLEPKAKAGNTHYQCLLAERYIKEAEAFIRSPYLKEGIRWYEEAKSANAACGFLAIANMYKKGNYYPQNAAISQNLLEECASSGGDTDCMYELYNISLDNQDIAKAYMWINLASHFCQSLEYYCPPYAKSRDWLVTKYNLSNKPLIIKGQELSEAWLKNYNSLWRRISFFWGGR